jgi:tetratricopeptide (TPR) repeat protein
MNRTQRHTKRFLSTWHIAIESKSILSFIAKIYVFRDLDSAIQSYERCLTINPKNPATYTALGFTYHLKGEFREALNCYHKANFLKHEDPLTEEMI